jgi:hypothetical protein
MLVWAEEDCFPAVLIRIEKYVTLEMMAQGPSFFVNILTLLWKTN